MAQGLDDMKRSVPGTRPWLLWLVAGVVSSVAAYAYLLNVEQRAMRAAFLLETHETLALIDRTVRGSVDAALIIADLAPLDPDRFQWYGEAVLARQPTLASLAYSRWTSAQEAPDLLRRLGRKGRIPALERGGAEPPEHHLIVTHIVPPSLGPSVIGNDVISLPGRRAAVVTAREQGRPVMTGPLQLGGRPADEAGVLIFAPVYEGQRVPDSLNERRQELVGMVSIGLLLEPMLREAPAHREDAPARIVVVDRNSGSILFDQSAAGKRRLETDVGKLAQTPMATWHTLTVAGRTWELLFVPTPGFLQAHSPMLAPSIALVLGLIVTSLAVAISRQRQQHAQATMRHLQERAEAASELARANEALENANREMESLVSSVSHDLRTPLQTLTTAGDQLRIGGETENFAVVREAVVRIDRAVQAMNRVVNGLLEHRRAGWAPTVLESIDLRELAQRVVSERTDDIQACGARVEVLDLPVIEGDRHKIATALDNLLSNALKYGCRSGGPQALVRIGSRVQQDEVCLYVSDNGVGIEREHREHIFKEFQRGEGAGPGLGLGLAIVDRVARAHGGRVWVEETPGGGATFVLALSRSAAPAEGH